MLTHLLTKLSKRKSSETVYNQYANKDVLNNLKLYLEYLMQTTPTALLVGEAPGHLGCAITGIPFASGEILMNSKHKFFVSNRKHFKLEKELHENTATAFWNIFENQKSLPIIWNAFPFHPHKKNILSSNRTPIRDEIEEGKEYLEMLYEIFKPDKLIGIGRKGERALNRMNFKGKISCVRHPSHGGCFVFQNQIKALFLNQ